MVLVPSLSVELQTAAIPRGKCFVKICDEASHSL